MNKELEEIIKKLEDDISVGEYSTTKTETLETALKELKKLQEEKKEIKKENSQYKRIKNIINSVTKEELDEAIKRADKEFIAKEKIKEKLEDLKRQYKKVSEENSIKAFILKCQIEILEELLEGK